MRMTGNNLLVEMDLSHNKEIVLADGTTLIRPDLWAIGENENGQVWESNMDLRDVNPQVATVIVGNDKTFLKPGDRIFTHFLCIENGAKVHYNGKECLFITTQQVYFVINGVNDYRMMPGIHLGEQVYTEAKTASGIFLTPDGVKKEVLQVDITHVPEEDAGCKVGDRVLSIDDYQYQLKWDNKMYVMLRKYELSGHVPENLVIHKNMSRQTKVY